MARKPRILLVEHDPNQRSLLTAALRDAGYAVDVVADAAEAEVQLPQRRYALLVSDWRLSAGGRDPVAAAAPMSGYVLLTPPRKATRHELLMKPAQPVEAVERFIGKAIVSLIVLGLVAGTSPSQARIGRLDQPRAASDLHANMARMPFRHFRRQMHQPQTMSGNALSG
jgi:CheY-like chemotaxis protein